MSQSSSEIDKKLTEYGQDFVGIYDRLGVIDSRLDRMDSRFESIDSRLDRMDSRFEAIDGRLGSIDSRLDVMDLRMATMNSNLETIIRNLNTGQAQGSS